MSGARLLRYRLTACAASTRPRVGRRGSTRRTPRGQAARAGLAPPAGAATGGGSGLRLQRLSSKLR